jgi:uncharacterized delta-60 repeat protein
MALLAACLFTGTAQASPGQLDRSFGHHGRVVRDIGQANGIDAVATQPDGKIVAVGTALRKVDGRDRYRLLVARFRVNGRLDRSFSGNGRAVVDLPGSRDLAADVAVQPNGKIVAAANTGYTSHYGPALEFGAVRLTPDGALDRRFGRQGIQTVYFGSPSDTDSEVHALAIAPHGKVILAGEFLPDNQNGEDRLFAVARLTSRGKLDDSFSGDGMQTTDFGGSYNVAYGVAIDGRERPVLAGVVLVPGSAGGIAGVARYLPDGSLDPSFSGDGTQTLPATTSFRGVADVSVDDTDRVLIAGTTRASESYRPLAFALARFGVTGNIDPTFGDAGMETTSFSGRRSAASAVALDGDGRIVLAGTVKTHGDGDFGLARYLPDGLPDTTFAGDGHLTTSLRRDDEGNDVALDAMGRIVVGGSADPLTALARYEP